MMTLSCRVAATAIASLLLVGSVIAFLFIGRSNAQPYVLTLLAALAVIGVFSLFAGAAGIVRLAGRDARDIFHAALADSAIDGLVVTDDKRRVVYANPAYMALTEAVDADDVRPVERVFVGDPLVSEAIYRLAKASREARQLQEEVRAPGLAGASVTLTSVAPAALVQSQAPVIVVPPVNTATTAGYPATFSVVASGSGTLSYQWSNASGPISGATGSSYTTPATTLAEHGSTYTVTVSNNLGSVSSTTVTLSVVAPSNVAITTQPAAQTVVVGRLMPSNRRPFRERSCCGTPKHLRVSGERPGSFGVPQDDGVTDSIAQNEHG